MKPLSHNLPLSFECEVDTMDMFQHRFEKDRLKEAPLAARMRPAAFQDFVGQEHLVAGEAGERQGLKMSWLLSRLYS